MTRWRAEKSGLFYAIRETGGVVQFMDDHSNIDDSYYETGNYFRTREEAEAVSAKFRAILDEHHKQNGGQK